MLFWGIADCVFFGSFIRTRFKTIWTFTSFRVYSFDQGIRFATCLSTEIISIELEHCLWWNWTDRITIVIFSGINSAIPLFISVYLVCWEQVALIASFSCSSPNALEDRLHAENFAWLLLHFDLHEWYLLPVIEDLRDWIEITRGVWTSLVCIIDENDSKNED